MLLDILQFNVVDHCKAKCQVKSTSQRLFCLNIKYASTEFAPGERKTDKQKTRFNQFAFYK